MAKTKKQPKKKLHKKAAKKMAKHSTPKKAAVGVKKQARARRIPKRLSSVLYSYVEPINNRHARDYGKKHFGSFSAYVDALIALDRKQSVVSVPVQVSKIKNATKKAAKKVAKKLAPKTKKSPKKRAPKAVEIPAIAQEGTAPESATPEQQAA